ncbi:MAG TPA: septum formation protein Maf [Bacteroidales bacterium]|nr:septum formation protein Maf [Bacteroidales bacterium]
MEQNGYKIILASNSPRRKELLSGLDIVYETRVLPDVDESYSNTLPLEGVPDYLAKKKASAYLQQLNDEELLITSDTVVLLDNIILGKPANEEEAALMLRTLSGKTHKVITAVCLTSIEKQVCFSDTSLVTFGQLTDSEISYYISRYKPFDKAGAYGVQEWIGYVAVERIEGSYYNVMGMPVFKLYKKLKEF